MLNVSSPACIQRKQATAAHTSLGSKHVVMKKRVRKYPINITENASVSQFHSTLQQSSVSFFFFDCILTKSLGKARASALRPRTKGSYSLVQVTRPLDFVPFDISTFPAIPQSIVHPGLILRALLGQWPCGSWFWKRSNQYH